jgi:hypothetical protein
MASTPRFTIPKVCKENWLQMNPSEKARFCNLCQKNVFDFTEGKSLESDQMVCLRYTESTQKTKTSNLIRKIADLFR